MLLEGLGDTLAQTTLRAAAYQRPERNPSSTASQKKLGVQVDITMSFLNLCLDFPFDPHSKKIKSLENVKHGNTVLSNYNPVHLDIYNYTPKCKDGSYKLSH